MSKYLIVNADDCNLTEGVTRGILECNQTGILTSTTFLVNLPVEAKTVRWIKDAKNLGVGVHLNLTLGQPVSKSQNVRSLVDEEGRFTKDIIQRLWQKKKTIVLEDIILEYRNQVKLFKKIFGKSPTHLDTHHQLHDYDLFLKALLLIAHEFKLPVRRSRLFPPGESLVKFRGKTVLTTHHWYGDLLTRHHWNKVGLGHILATLPEGVSEIMCHPGHHDAQLSAVSSFTKSRDIEKSVFSSKQLRSWVKKQGILLTHYGECRV